MAQYFLKSSQAVKAGLVMAEYREWPEAVCCIALTPNQTDRRRRGGRKRTPHWQKNLAANARSLPFFHPSPTIAPSP